MFVFISTGLLPLFSLLFAERWGGASRLGATGALEAAGPWRSPEPVSDTTWILGGAEVLLLLAVERLRLLEERVLVVDEGVGSSGD